MIERVYVIVIMLISTGISQTTAQTLFERVGVEQGVQIKHRVPPGEANFGTGAAWFDYDNDGDLDLLVTNNAENNQLFRNNRIGTGTSDFTEVASGDLLCEGCKCSGVSVADYDNDGDDDIFLCNISDDVLLRNDGDGNFVNVTMEAFGMADGFMPGFGSSASWGDVNNDGWLDLYISNHTFGFTSPISTQDHLFISSGGPDITFTDYSDMLAGDTDGTGTDDREGFGFIGIFTDYDKDADLDIYLANDCPLGTEDNQLWRNEGDLGFEQVSGEVGPFGPSKKPGFPDCHAAMGLSRGDVNRDGFLDYHFTNIHYDGLNSILVLGNGSYMRNVSEAAGLDDNVFEPDIGLLFTWGTLIMDYDLDGWQDIYIASGALGKVFQPNFLYRNPGSRIAGVPVFEQIPVEESGAGIGDRSRTVVRGDYDMDGDPDIYVVNLDSLTNLLENKNESGNNWMIVELDGAGAPMSNRNGIGAKVILRTPDKVQQLDEIYSGSSLGGGDDIAAYFGLGAFESADIRVIWPSGLETDYGRFNANQRLILKEPQGQIISPLGGDFIAAGGTDTVLWKTTANGSFKMVLEKNGTEVGVIADSIQGGSPLEWQVDEQLESGQGYRIRLISRGQDSLDFTMQETFCVYNDQTEYAHLVYPNGDELITHDSTVNIEWSVSDKSESKVDLYLIRGDQIDQQIAADIENTGSYSWQVSGVDEGNAFRIQIVTKGAESITDYSDQTFVISAPSIVDVEENIEDKIAEEISIYPNPTADRLYLDFGSEIMINVNCAIYNMSGQLVLRNNLMNNSDFLDVSSLSPGMYFLNISVNGHQGYFQKLIVNR